MKRLLILFLLPALLLLFPLPSRAEDARQEEKAAMDALPEEVRSAFISNGRLALPDFGDFIGMILDGVGQALKNSGGDAALFLGSILLCSIFTLLQKSLARQQEGVLRLVLLLCGCTAVYTAYKGASDLALTHLQTLVSLLGAYVPAVTGAAAAMGGVTSAALSAAALGMILSMIGQFALGVLFPMLKVTLALDLCSEIGGHKGLFAFARTLRGLFITLLGVVTALLSGVFALQNVIAAKTDSVSLRAVRFSLGSAVPMVGPAVSEGARTLLSGLSLMRSTIGAVGVCALLLCFIPTLLLLLTARLILNFSAGFAASLDAQPLDRLFSAGGTAAGGLCAVLSLVDLCALIALASTMYTGI